MAVLRYGGICCLNGRVFSRALCLRPRQRQREFRQHTEVAHCAKIRSSKSLSAGCNAFSSETPLGGQDQPRSIVGSSRSHFKTEHDIHAACLLHIGKMYMFRLEIRSATHGKIIKSRLYVLRIGKRNLRHRVLCLFFKRLFVWPRRVTFCPVQRKYARPAITKSR